MARFYISVSEHAVFVKDGSLFADQGGLTEPWGNSWIGIEAVDLAHARARAHATRRQRFPHAERLIDDPDDVTFRTGGLLPPEPEDELAKVRRPGERIVSNADCQTHWVPKVGEVCRHHSGRVYTVIAIANVNSSAKFPKTVVYMGANGEVWARPIGEFAEKFELVYDGAQIMPNGAI